MWPQCNAYCHTDRGQLSPPEWGKMWSWLDCWSQTSYFECFWNCWSPEIFTHNSLKNGAQNRKQQWAGALQSETSSWWERPKETTGLVLAHRKTMVSQITAVYNCGELKSISEWTTHGSFKQNSRRPCQVPPWTEIWSCRGHRCTKMEPQLMNHNFCLFGFFIFLTQPHGGTIQFYCHNE